MSSCSIPKVTSSVSRDGPARDGRPDEPCDLVRMLAGMTETEQSDAFRILWSMIHSLRDGNDGA